MLRIETLGGPAFFRDSNPVDVKSKRQVGLLVFLAWHEGKRVSRDILTEMFWTSSSPANARHSISQAAYSLRQTFPSLCLELHRDYLQIPVDTLSIDVLDLRRAIRAKNLTDVRRLDVADFLDGFWIDGCGYFSEWQEGARSDLRHDLVAFYRTCMREAEKTEDWMRVAVAVEGLLRI